jgi:hypothetical protein
MKPWIVTFAAVLTLGLIQGCGDNIEPMPHVRATPGCTAPAGAGFARYSTGILLGVVDVPFLLDNAVACPDVVPPGPKLPAGYQQVSPTRLSVEWGNNDIATGDAEIDYTFTDADGRVTPWTFTFAVEIYTGSRGLRN